MDSDDRVLTTRRRLLVRGALLALAAAGAVAGLFVVAVVPPTIATFYPKCAFHQTTGLHCPGCGLTRGLHSLLNGELGQAVAYNPLTFVLVPVIGWAIFRSLWAWAWDRPVSSAGFFPRWSWYVFLGSLLAFGLLRNVPVYPLTLLAPHELAR